jgi:ribosomal protein S18 acetylase RimI-like enzyme
MIKFIEEQNLKKEISKTILDDLPEWFGIPEYTQEYINKSSTLPFFAAFVDDNPVGFISLKKTSDVTAEIYCMGIKKQFHRNGLGKLLHEAFEKYAQRNNFKFLQVKTVQFGKYSSYDKTNLFYKSIGYYELEVLPTLWDEWNPCQILVKFIG